MKTKILESLKERIFLPTFLKFYKSFFEVSKPYENRYEMFDKELEKEYYKKLKIFLEQGTLPRRQIK